MSVRFWAETSPEWQTAHFSLCPYMEEEARVSAVCSVKVLIPFTWAQPSGPNHLPKTPPLNTRASYHTGHAFSTQEFRGTWSFRPVPVCIRSHVRLFMTSWTVACQSPKSMEFSIQTRPTLHVKRVSYMLYELHLSKKSTFWEAKLRQALLPPERVCLAVRKPWVLEPAALRSESRDYNPIWVLLSSWLGWPGTLRNIGGVIWV